MMDEMAKYGRYGDTMLVHMNPVEVAGIASLVPGGLTQTQLQASQRRSCLSLLALWRRSWSEGAGNWRLLWAEPLRL